MIILGLDVAQKTGSALYDDSRPLSAIEAGVLKAVGQDYEDKSAALARALFILVREAKPDLIAIAAKNTDTYRMLQYERQKSAA